MIRRAVKWVRENGLATWLACMSALTIVCIIGLVIVFAGLGEQAAAGQKARTVQCDREPVASKIAKAAYAVRDSLPAEAQITPEELARWHKAAPKGCPQ